MLLRRAALRARPLAARRRTIAARPLTTAPRPALIAAPRRALSSAAPAAAPAAAAAAPPDDDGWSKFVPYAVMSAIGGLGFWFWRASTAHSNRDAIIASVEEEQPLASDERDTLRDANATFLQPERFESVATSVLRVLNADAGTPVDYVEFCGVCDRYLDRSIEGGHLLDRCALHVASPNLEAGLLVVVLSLCAGGDAVERAACLGRALACEDRPALDALVDWLVRTGQVRPSKQVEEGDSSLPAQTYARRGASSLVGAALDEVGIEGPFTAADVAAVLTSKAVDYH